MVETVNRNVCIFFTGSEAKKSGIPFLLDAEMRPLSAANSWLRKISRGGATSSFHTGRAYGYALFDFFSYLHAHDIDWQEVTNDTVTHYRDVQDQNPSPHTKKPVSRRTINSRLLCVGRFYAYAADERFIDKNPLEYKELKRRLPVNSDLLAHTGRQQTIEVPYGVYERIGGSRIKWRPHHEVVTWLNSITCWRDKLLGKLLYRTGMRRDEIANLKTCDLPRRASVDASKLEVSFIITGKGRRQREVYLATRDYLELLDYIKIERAAYIRRAKKKHDYIFVVRDGKPLLPAYINRIFKCISEKCGIMITPHVLRHSFAVFALRHWKAIGLSQPQKLLQYRLGHKSLSTTEIYMHITDEDAAEEAHGNATLIELFLRDEE